jgi:hypothetical protein
MSVICLTSAGSTPHRSKCPRECVSLTGAQVTDVPGADLIRWDVELTALQEPRQAGPTEPVTNTKRIRYCIETGRHDNWMTY